MARPARPIRPTEQQQRYSSKINVIDKNLAVIELCFPLSGFSSPLTPTRLGVLGTWKITLRVPLGKMVGAHRPGFFLSARQHDSLFTAIYRTGEQMYEG